MILNEEPYVICCKFCKALWSFADLDHQGLGKWSIRTRIVAMPLIGLWGIRNAVRNQGISSRARLSLSSFAHTCTYLSRLRKRRCEDYFSTANWRGFLRGI